MLSTSCPTVVLCLALGLAASGCEEQLTEVGGVVTLDGRPLPNATITFTPRDGRRGSIGLTNVDGQYELHYSLTRVGAWPGEHDVRISTYTQSDGYGGGAPTVISEERVPARYNQNTELTARVGFSHSQFDWSISSDGQIIQPQPSEVGGGYDAEPDVATEQPDLPTSPSPSPEADRPVPTP
jgi:hypothetical protein